MAGIIWERTERRRSMKIFKAVAVILCGIAASLAAVAAATVPVADYSAVTAYPLLVSDDGGNNASRVNVLIRKGDAAAILKDEDRTFVPLGAPFGIKLYTDGVMVVGFTDVLTVEGAKAPCRDAGIQKGDVILTLDGRKIASNEEMAAIVESSEGKTITVRYRRAGAVYSRDVVPAKDKDGVYKLGIWIRDSAAGIGTVTFYEPESGLFGGLGHAVCDADTGVLMPISRASVYKASIEDVIKGRKGAPGGLVGVFISQKPYGEIYLNTSYGVFGRLDADVSGKKTYASAKYDEITAGAATIVTTVDGVTPKEYKVNIEKVSSAEKSEKNFVITVTDEELLSITGGIVQGMSGSPILQNGKIIGAVTHVLVNDPTRGYGVYIGNMLRAADMIYGLENAA